jgi:hypothetical protein
MKNHPTRLPASAEKPLSSPFNREGVGSTGRSCGISASGGGGSRSAGRLQSRRRLGEVDRV